MGSSSVNKRRRDTTVIHGAARRSIIVMKPSRDKVNQAWKKDATKRRTSFLKKWYYSKPVIRLKFAKDTKIIKNANSHSKFEMSSPIQNTPSFKILKQHEDHHR